MRILATGKPEGCKLIRVEAEIDTPGGEAGRPVVRRIQVRGDFFAIPEESFELLESGLAGTDLANLAGRFDTLSGALGIRLFGIHGAAVKAVLEEGMHAASMQDS